MGMRSGATYLTIVNYALAVMKVEGYDGWVSIDGRHYEKDIIVHLDGSITDRRTELSMPKRVDYFHTPLSEQELDFING
jgi:hypothetical protein